VEFCKVGGGVLPKVAHPTVSPDNHEVAFLTSYGHVAQLADASDVAVVATDGTADHIVHATPPTPCIPTENGTAAQNQAVTLVGWSR
jgi:hypothetical protein